MPRDVSVILPILHPRQQEIKDHGAERKVLDLGRRWGKTSLLADVATEGFLHGKKVLYAVPIADQATSFWKYVSAYLNPLIQADVVYKNEALRVMRMEDGELQAKTAWDADSLRSSYADELMLDEFPLMDPDTWDEVGAPMMLDNEGSRAWFVGTPKRRNHFFRFYQRGNADPTERWKSWKGSSHENPHLSKQALDDMTSDMTEAAYQQEIMAEFLEGEGAVFHGLDLVMGAPETAPGDHEGHQLAMGIDWGKVDDYSAWSIGCKDCGHEVAHDRFRRVDYTRQRGRVVAAVQKWGVTRLIPEQNSIGDAILSELQRDEDMYGVRIEPFKMSSVSKPTLIENLVRAIETARFQWLASSVWKTELEAYEVKYTKHDNPQYSAPQGVHDDTVIARALMWRALTQVRTYKFASM